MRLHLVIALTTILASAPPLLAQTSPAENPRDNQLSALEHQRKFLLAMADSMPERLYRDKVTPEQRDFAQQVHHAASAVAFICSSVMKGPKLSLPDSATALNSRAALKGFVNAAYDYSVALLKTQTPEARARTADLFGQSMPTWKVWDEIQIHTIWTAGQMVANFRKHGMAPPAFTFF
jgi:hypothetical protein